MRSICCRLMRGRTGLAAMAGWGFWCLLAVLAAAQDAEPILRLEAGGPTSYVTALALSPDGQTLYAGSWDKTVHVWRWDAARREFRADPAAFRVPIGPGLS